jgi:four helix bundle protein
MKPRHLAQRTYEFGVAIVNLCKALPDGPEARRIRGQLAGAGTAVAANYRGACRARSRAEFISKIAVCAEEADESHMWLNMCVDVDLTSRAAVQRWWMRLNSSRRSSSQRNSLRRDEVLGRLTIRLPPSCLIQPSSFSLEQ